MNVTSVMKCTYCNRTFECYKTNKSQCVFKVRCTCLICLIKQLIRDDDTDNEYPGYRSLICVASTNTRRCRKLHVGFCAI